jgi:hypothetical protein
MFLQILFESHFFILFIFQSKFHFVDSFHIAPVVRGDPLLQNLELAVHVIIYPQRLFRFQSHNDVCVSW